MSLQQYWGRSLERRLISCEQQDVDAVTRQNAESAAVLALTQKKKLLGSFRGKIFCSGPSDLSLAPPFMAAQSSKADPPVPNMFLLIPLVCVCVCLYQWTTCPQEFMRTALLKYALFWYAYCGIQMSESAFKIWDSNSILSLKYSFRILKDLEQML